MTLIPCPLNFSSKSTRVPFPESSSGGDTFATDSRTVAVDKSAGVLDPEQEPFDLGPSFAEYQVGACDASLLVEDWK